MWNKHKYAILSFILIVGIFLTGVRLPDFARAADKTNLLDVKKTILQDGNPIPESPGIDLNKGIFVRLSFDLPVKGDDIQDSSNYFEKNDTAKIRLGEGVKIPAGTASPIKKDLIFRKTAGGVTEAVKVGEVSFAPDASGDMYANFAFNGDDRVFDGTFHEVKVEAGVDFALKTDDIDPNDLNNKTKIVLGTTYSINPKVDDKVTIEKKSEVNGGFISWTLTVSRSAIGKKMPLTGYKIEDDLSDVSMPSDDSTIKQVIENSFKVNGNSVNPNGSYNVASKKLSYTFTEHDTDVEGKAVVTFRTDMGFDFVSMPNNTKNNKSYKNVAKVLDSQDKLKDTAEDEFIWGGFGYKDGKVRKDSGHYFIDWEILFNEEEQELNNVKVRDVLPQAQFGKAELEFKSYRIEKYDKDSLSWVTHTAETDVEPSGSEYTIGNINSKIKLYINTEVKYKNGATPGSFAHFTNNAHVIWDGHPKGQTSLGKKLTIGDPYVRKSAVTVDSSSTVGFETEWRIKVDATNISDTRNLYLYDYFIFDKDTKVTEINKGNTSITIKEEGNETNTNLSSTVNLKKIFEGENRGQRYVQGSVQSETSGFNPNVKVYKIYTGAPEKHVGDLVEIGGFKQGEINTLTLKSLIAHGVYLTKVNESSNAYNLAYLVDNGEPLGEDHLYPVYNSKIFSKQAFPATTAKKIIDKDYTVGTVNEGIFENNAGIDNKEGAYDKDSKSIIYRISVNATGIHGLNEDLVVTDKAPDGWGFQNITDTEKYLIYEGESYTGKGNKDATVRATKRVENLSASGIFPTEETDGKLKFTFKNIGKPYVIILKAVMKEDDVTRKKYFNKKVTVENTAGVEILGAHGTDKQNVTVDEEILTKTSDESKLEDGYITWTITYKPYGFLDKDAKITLDDILSEGMELRKYKSDNTLIFEGDNFKVTEDNTNLMGEDLSNMFTYDGSNRTLKIKLRDKTKTYTISYITDITDVKKAGDGLNNTVKVIEGTVGLPMEPNRKDYIIGNAYANATLKGYKSFRVIKTDSADSNKKLKGAKFRLKAKAAGSNYDKEEVTDNNGIVVFYKLTEGEYELIETAAPKDSNGKSYTLDSTPRIINVRELGVGFEVTLPDGTKSNEITITNSLPGDTPPTDPTDPPTPTTSTDPNPPTPPTTPTIPTTPTDPTPSTPPTTPTTPPTDPTPSTPPTTPTTPTTPTVPEDPDTEDPEDPDTEEPEDPETPETPDPEEPDVPTDPTPTAPAYNINEVPDPNDPDSPDEITVIGEDGTPLGTFIKKKKPDGTFEYVLADDGTPLGAFKAKEKLPNTGGSNNLWYYTAGAGLILAAGFALKKREEEQ